MTEQKQPNAGIWGLVIVGVLVLYPVSLGPACWLSSRLGGEEVVTAVYRPLTWTAAVTKSQILRNGIQWYSTLGAAQIWSWTWSETPDGEPRPEWYGVEFDIDFHAGPPMFTRPVPAVARYHTN